MKISEIFYSVCGEGKNIGTPAVFIRLWGCNLNCSFCDTKYALDPAEYHEMTTEEVAKIIKQFNCRNVVFTGGEPMIQYPQLIEVMESLLGILPLPPRWHFEIETNGTIRPTKRMLELVDMWSISPKLSNAGIKPYKISSAFFDDEYDEGDVILKFVVDKPSDFAEIQKYLKSNDNFRHLENEQIFLMPQAITPEEHNKKLPFIIAFAKEYGYRVTPRLQILAYGNKRGV